MGNPALHRHVQVSDDHGTVTSADVTITQQTVRTARASLRAAAGHLAPGSRARLVDAVLDLPELHNGGRLEAAFPLGDSETLHRLRQRCTDVTTRPAGSTVLLEATIGPARRPAGPRTGTNWAATPSSSTCHTTRRHRSGSARASPHC
jgi:hypothetical protein